MGSLQGPPGAQLHTDVCGDDTGEEVWKSILYTRDFRLPPARPSLPSMFQGTRCLDLPLWLLGGRTSSLSELCAIMLQI